MTELRDMMSEDESVVWEGKPDKKCFILECIFTPLLPVALVWGIVDFGLLGLLLFSDRASDPIVFFAVPFLMIHLMPVWIYLAGAIFSFLKHRHIEYLVTDKGVYVSGGLFSRTTVMKPYTDLGPVSTHQGIFDQVLGVGDVVMNPGIKICDISDFREVSRKIKKLQEDIYSDTMYPNDLRPAENHGYRTKYKGNIE